MKTTTMKTTRAKAPHVMGGRRARRERDRAQHGGSEYDDAIAKPVALHDDRSLPVFGAGLIRATEPNWDWCSEKALKPGLSSGFTLNSGDE
jgi:hypothetical protein